MLQLYGITNLERSTKTVGQQTMCTCSVFCTVHTHAIQSSGSFFQADKDHQHSSALKQLLIMMVA